MRRLTQRFIIFNQRKGRIESDRESIGTIQNGK